MGIPILIYGKSGAGKSRSLKNFGSEELCLVNVLGKPLPFKGQFKYTLDMTKPLSTGEKPTIQTVMAWLSKMPTKVAVIDDFGYIMTNLFMNGHGQGDQFKLYNTIGDAVWNFINFVQGPAVAPDAIVYLIMHEDMAEDGTSKLRTIGKLLDQKVCLEGMVTVVLHAMTKGERHLFLTNSDGNDLAKSPEEMFTEREVDNDLKAVDDAIRDYWGLQKTAKKGGKA